jgi:hypothetical protein
MRVPANRERLEQIDAALDGARLLGLELDLEYRVLAATVDPGAGVTEPTGDTVDRRLQILLHPCSEVTALLVLQGPEGHVAERFEESQLPAVVAAMDEPELTAPVVAAPPAPRFPAEVSLRGVSSAPDGRTHRALFDVRGAGRRLVLLARFDDIELRDAAGDPVDPAP